MKTIRFLYLFISILPFAFGQTTVKRVPAKPTASVNGKDLYRQYCASCHGADAKGNGPAASAMKSAPSDLTQIAARNGGRFPDERMREILEGTREVPAHGSRDMPVWGAIFNNMSPNLTLTQTRIHSLMSYIEDIQVK